MGAVLAGGLGPATAVAVSPSPAPQPSASVSYGTKPTPFSLTVSPTRLVIDAADIERSQQFTAVNRGEHALTVMVDKRNFVARPDGSMAYQKAAPFGAESWLTISPRQFVVQPGAAQVVTATVRPPDRTEPGDHQAAIVFMVPSGRAAGNIAINRGVATPVYVTVPGPVEDTVVLTHFSAPSVTAGGTVPLSLSVENRGTVHRDFRGPTAITVHAAGKPASFPDFTVPRGTSRDTSTTWQPPLVCICHPSVSFPNADGTLQTSTIRVVVFPWPLALGVLAALLVVLLLLRLRRRRTAPAVVPAASSAVSSGDA
ncbi:hypothetical protein [uncultured Friedmanniella sp.]|uniref:hypothetical protein n=1 Tax=uncultured Friedmanniella sp. TaxID=335381 RepID=UPI0035CBA314